jgi:alpha-ribazole phosphatase
MRLWLARHAAVVRQDAICYGRLDLVADDALTQEAALHLHRTLPPDVAVRRSPARRCRQLASALASLRPGLSIAVDPDLLEMDFGHWEGRPWDAIGEPALSAWTRDFASHRPGGGESVQQLLDRVQRAMQREGDCDDALWITHAGVIRAARLLLSGVRAVERADQWPRDEVPFGGVECHALGN